MRHLNISVCGGLGDRICAEPVIRYMHSRWLNNDDLILTCENPEIFAHLPLTCQTRNLEKGPKRLSAYTFPPDFESLGKPIPIDSIHPVDYIAIRLLRRTLPHKDKSIRLAIYGEKLSRVRGLVGDVERAVLIHAGRSWQSKTFPADIWQSYVEHLQKKGFKIILIGQEMGDLSPMPPTADPGLKSQESRGTVPLLGDRCLNLVNKLDLQELFALISHVPVLITNDSAPLHVAGAFDQWVGVIATIKRPDYILPFRKGTQTYKTQALERFPIYENLDYDPLEFIHCPRPSVPEELLREAAPTPSQIEDFVEKALGGV